MQNQYKPTINAAYILGLTDAEGMFTLTPQKGGGPTGHQFSLEFKITQKNHSVAVLHAIKDFFDCGRIAIDHRQDATMKFIVTDIASIVHILIPFFTENVLLTSKCMNFNDFKAMAEIIRSKSHLTQDGATKLLDTFAGMNSKRSWISKYNFLLSHTINVTPGWLQGFIDGDGSFTT